MNLKTYCFDLDGTLCTQTRNEDGRPEQDPEKVREQAKPIQERIAVVNELHDLGNKILIDTARGTQHPEDRDEWTKITEDQLKKWGVKYHELRVGIKLAADVYVDDMARNDKRFFKSPGHSYKIKQQDDDWYYSDQYSRPLKLDMGEPYGPKQ